MIVKPSNVSRTELEQQHRARILDATRSIVSVAGYAELSITSILAVSKVHRRSFNAMFASKHEAFLSVYREFLGQLSGALADADDPAAEPFGRVVACLGATIEFLLADPVRAEIVLLEVHAAGIDAVDLQRAGLEALVDRTAAMLIDAGADDAGAARFSAELAVGAAHDALRSGLHRGELDRLPRLVPDLARAAFPTLA